MKNNKLIKSILVLVFSLVLSVTLTAQTKPQIKHPGNCKCESCASAVQEDKHVCTDECKINGCTHSDSGSVEEHKSHVKHVCTVECKTKGCDFVKAKEAKAALDLNNDGYIYECPMKCEEGSDKAGKCSKCGMELKKVSVKI